MTRGPTAKIQLFLKVLLHRQFFVQLMLHFCSLTLLDKLMDVHMAFFFSHADCILSCNSQQKL